MESGTPVTIVAKQGVICRNLLATTSTPRLTPTGKISYAKTRVYTQRYRKEWEQMPEFKGWLTSVPSQSTRAYCLFCKKNLHAHRLSLLKHTCTMKHQRSALTHQMEEKETQKLDTDTPEVGLMEEVETLDDSSQTELGEDNEDFEYVVERLETDEDESMEFENVKEKIEERQEDSMEQEEEKEMDDSQLNDDSTSVIKKMKLLPEQKCRDSLTEAVVDVHSEYLEEEIGNQENVQMEMVIESANDDISILSEPVDVDVEKTPKSQGNEKTVIKATKNGKVLLENSKDNLIVTSSLPILNTSYQTNISTSTAPTQNTLNFMPIAPKTQKTITLMCGNKSFSLTGGTFQPGTHYILTRIKGKPTAFMMTNPGKVELENKIKVEPAVSDIDQSPTVPSTSQELTVNQHSVDTKLLNIKKVTDPTPIEFKPAKQPPVLKYEKKLRISTYVVDTVKGVPICGLQVSLYKLMDGKWTFLNENNTNTEGHCNDLMENINGTIGRYKIHFNVDKYFSFKKIDTMFPFVEIVFDVKNSNALYHIPLLLSPFGYTTYREPTKCCVNKLA